MTIITPTVFIFTVVEVSGKLNKLNILYDKTHQIYVHKCTRNMQITYATHVNNYV